MEAFGHDAREDPPRHEPAIRAPWPVAALSLAILAAYALQAALQPTAVAAARFGFAPGDLEQGWWSGLLTALFVHGGWIHAGLNALALLAFGAPVARLLGVGGRGACVFLAFYLLCGVMGSLAYAAISREGVLIGASGAVAGLMGFASRIDPRDPLGRLAPLAAKPVWVMAGSWVAVNVLIGFIGLSVAGGAPVAWQAHLGGYAAGLLLAPLAIRAAGRRGEG